MKFSKTFWNIVVVLVFIAVLVGGFLYLDAIHKAEVASAQIEREVSEQNLRDQISNLNSCALELNKKIEELTIGLDIAIEENEMLHEQIEKQQAEIESYKAQIADEEAKWQRRYEEYP
jgi:peptidoglycan hydrolase CwlO-like protein